MGGPWRPGPAWGTGLADAERRCAAGRRAAAVSALRAPSDALPAAPPAALVFVAITFSVVPPEEPGPSPAGRDHDPQSNNAP